MRSGRRRRRARLVLAGVMVITALLALAAVLRPDREQPAPSASIQTPTTSPAADPDRADARPSRGGDRRADRPRTSPAPESPPATAPEPGPAEPAPAPDGGEVVETGSCDASYCWEPQPTASGEVFDPEAMTAAHRTWDFIPGYG